MTTFYAISVLCGVRDGALDLFRNPSGRGVVKAPKTAFFNTPPHLMAPRTPEFSAFGLRVYHQRFSSQKLRRFRSIGRRRHRNQVEYRSLSAAGTVGGTPPRLMRRAIATRYLPIPRTTGMPHRPSSSDGHTSIFVSSNPIGLR
jgi:hypothetical protein